LAYLLLALLQYHLRALEMTAEEALLELDSMYKVYLRDTRKNFQVTRVVTLTKKQETILNLNSAVGTARHSRNQMVGLLGSGFGV